MDNDLTKHRLEIAEAVLLSLAVLGTAWSAYQSTLWSGIQTFSLADANARGREATAQQMLAEQQRTTDGMVIVHFLDAFLQKKQDVVDFYLTRTRPEMRKALQAWLDTNPLKNPGAPAHPGLMPDYAKTVPLKFEDEHKRLLAESERKMQNAMEANQNGDRYVLLTVLFATVLCFVGLGSKLESSRVRTIVLGLAALLLTIPGVLVAIYPLARE
jgi:hypothetical protein